MKIAWKKKHNNDRIEVEEVGDDCYIYRLFTTKKEAQKFYGNKAELEKVKIINIKINEIP